MRNLYKNSKNFKVIDRHISRVPKQLKKIDAGYFVVWNDLKGKFEVHNENQSGSSLAFVVHAEELDNRTMIKARETAIHRADELMDKIRKSEKKMEADKRKKAGDAFERQASLAYDKIMRKPQVVVK